MEFRQPEISACLCELLVCLIDEHEPASEKRTLITLGAIPKYTDSTGHARAIRYSNGHE
jgi:hypothetical protein